MKEAIIKFVFNLLALALYVAFGTIGFYYGGFALSQALGFGFLFGLILGCLNEERITIYIGLKNDWVKSILKWHECISGKVITRKPGNMHN